MSTLTFILSTLEDFKEDHEIDPNSTFNLTLEYIDTAVIIFFTLEYAIRFICAPRKWKFFKDAMNLVDILAIIPFYLGMHYILLPNLDWSWDWLGKVFKIKVMP